MSEPRSVSLRDSWDKLGWAEQNFNALASEIKAVEQADSYRISVEVDPDGGQYTYRVHDLPALDASWGLRIGDILHNARSALDYLMVRLYALGTGEAPIDVGKGIDFPIYNDAGQFKGSAAAAEFRKNPVLSGWLARIEELQPYNAGNPSIWGWDADWEQHRTFPRLPIGLDRISYLDNVDKHRCILAVKWTGKFGSRVPEAPADFKSIGGSLSVTDALVDGTEIASWRYAVPLPFEWQPDEVDMKRRLALEVGFPDPSPVQSVERILGWCLWSVHAVLEIFDPVFMHREPPLSVTYSLPPREPMPPGWPTA